jgi:hypothetical protein
MSNVNPWVSEFNVDTGVRKFISPKVLDSILASDIKVQLERPNDEPMYVVDKPRLQIKRFGESISQSKTFANSNYTTFFEWLSKQKDYVEVDKTDITKYKIMSSIKNVPNLSSAITIIFNKLNTSVTEMLGGSLRRRNRRPSRKYKKSKRVLRRKSRSTRRR